jgi:hypothetical protein
MLTLQGVARGFVTTSKKKYIFRYVEYFGNVAEFHDGGLTERV